MQQFGKSQPIKRREDVRFLTGTGQYSDDITPEGALHAFFVRSPMAHADITGIDTTEAAAVPGVHAIYTAASLAEAGVKSHIGATLVKNLDGTDGADPARPFLAQGRVRFVGEPVAMVVAETLAQAKDAAELVEIDYDELETHMAVAPGGFAVHAEAPDNVAFDWGHGDAEATAKALAEAAHVVSLSIDDNRIIVNSMEPRACWAEIMEDGRLHVCYGGQGVWGLKGGIAKALGMNEADIRVTTPDVGGGFGMKGMVYPEYFSIAHATRALGKPVRWISERTEAMLTDNAGRDLVSTATLGFDENHKLIAYKCETLCNLGAYNSQFAQPIQTQLFAKVFTGVYDIQTAYLGVKGIYTNTTQVDAYRGAGRPEAIYVLERAMDYAARELGVSQWDLRRKSFIQPDQFPYTTLAPETYDVGEFAMVLGKAAEHADVAGFEARKAEAASRGKLLGLGLCYYIEAILGAPSEGATVEFTADGRALLYVGTQSNGQGHETVFAQFLSDLSGIPAEKIEVVQGDSDRIASGGGTGGSRSVTVQNTATIETIEIMVKAFTPFLAEEMGVDEADLSFEDGVFRAEGSNMTPGLMEAAEMARTAGREDLLRHQGKATLPGRSFPNGAHIAEMEIDPETGVVVCTKYTVTDDFGNLINPMLAEGQVHGGVAQGLGQALVEHVVHDEDGQLLTATFMDYGMPRADDLPMIAFYSEPVPSKNNPMGMKGCGEAGTVGALAAVANAVLDATWDLGLRQVDMPFTPHRTWTMLQQAEKVAAE